MTERDLRIGNVFPVYTLGSDIFNVLTKLTSIYTVEFHNSSFFAGTLNIYRLVNSTENWKYLLTHININAVYKWSSEITVHMC
jgi:hypothetical protein